MALLEQINDFLWGLPLIILLMGTHIYFTCRLRFPQKNLFRAIRLSLFCAQDPPSARDASAPQSADRNLSPFSALSTTLAATLGTGNIIGVSTAVARRMLPKRPLPPAKGRRPLCGRPHVCIKKWFT